MTAWVVWLIAWLNDFFGLLFACFVDFVDSWFVDWLSGWLACLSIVWLQSCFTGCLIVLAVSYSIDILAFKKKYFNFTFLPGSLVKIFKIRKKKYVELGEGCLFLVRLWHGCSRAIAFVLDILTDRLIR